MFQDIEEVNKSYDGNWVFMINCREDDTGKIIGGEVVLYSENRDKVLRKMEKYDQEESITYLRYAGKIPKGVSVIL